MNIYTDKRKKKKKNQFINSNVIVKEKALRRIYIHSKKGHQEKQASTIS